MSARSLTLDGVTRTIPEWAEQPEVKAIGITRRCIAHRVLNRWSDVDALTVPHQAEHPSVIRARREAEEAAALPDGSPLIRKLTRDLIRVERRMRAVLDVLEHAASIQEASS